MQQKQIDEEAARKIIEEADARRSKEAEDARLAKRDEDRRAVRPGHFHATIWTFREQDGNGSMKDSTHHEVLAMTVDGLIRRALNRASSTQKEHHVAQISDCTDPTHGSRELRD